MRARLPNVRGPICEPPPVYASTRCRHGCGCAGIGEDDVPHRLCLRAFDVLSNMFTLWAPKLPHTDPKFRLRFACESATECGCPCT